MQPILVDKKTKFGKRSVILMSWFSNDFPWILLKSIRKQDYYLNIKLAFTAQKDGKISVPFLNITTIFEK